ncbi:MAG TPA: YihY/virulence factor BrkB family protein [Chthoniobacteraceae bacterium]|jgi:membrane protein
MKTFLALLRETYVQWTLHKAPKMGAALAYYTTFSLAPLVILTLSLVTLIFDRETARAGLVTQFNSLVGSEGGAILDTILAQSASQRSGLLGTIIGIGVLLLGASGVFGELQDSLNQLWEIPPKKRPILAVIKDRLLSFSMVFVIGFLLLVSLVLSALLAAVNKFMDGFLPGLDALWEIGNFAASLVVITLLFAIIFRVLPDVRIAWRDVWIGAALTSLLFAVGKFLLALYIGRSAFESSYGAAGSIIALLLWVFYSSQILFFGAAFTRVYARREGTHQHSSKPLRTKPIGTEPAT